MAVDKTGAQTSQVASLGYQQNVMVYQVKYPHTVEELAQQLGLTPDQIPALRQANGWGSEKTSVTPGEWIDVPVNPASTPQVQQLEQTNYASASVPVIKPTNDNLVLQFGNQGAMGASNPLVSVVQQQLEQLGYLDAAQTKAVEQTKGQLGPETESALEQFAKDWNAKNPQDQINFDPASPLGDRKILNALLQLSSGRGAAQSDPKTTLADANQAMDDAASWFTQVAQANPRVAKAASGMIAQDLQKAGQDLQTLTGGVQLDPATSAAVKAAGDRLNLLLQQQDALDARLSAAPTRPTGASTPTTPTEAAAPSPAAQEVADGVVKAYAALSERNPAAAQAEYARAVAAYASLPDGTDKALLGTQLTQLQSALQAAPATAPASSGPATPAAPPPATLQAGGPSAPAGQVNYAVATDDPAQQARQLISEASYALSHPDPSLSALTSTDSLDLWNRATTALDQVPDGPARQQLVQQYNALTQQMVTQGLLTSSALGNDTAPTPVSSPAAKLQGAFSTLAAAIRGKDNNAALDAYIKAQTYLSQLPDGPQKVAYTKQLALDEQYLTRMKVIGNHQNQAQSASTGSTTGTSSSTGTASPGSTGEAAVSAAVTQAYAQDPAQP